MTGARDAYDVSEDLMRDSEATFTERFLQVALTAEAPLPPPGPAPAVSTSVGRLGARAATVPEAGRNDPCPCGSGKKYKKCHGQGK